MSPTSYRTAPPRCEVVLIAASRPEVNSPLATRHSLLVYRRSFVDPGWNPSGILIGDCHPHLTRDRRCGRMTNPRWAADANDEQRSTHHDRRPTAWRSL